MAWRRTSSVARLRTSGASPRFCTGRPSAAPSLLQSKVCVIRLLFVDRELTLRRWTRVSSTEVSEPADPSYIPLTPTFHQLFSFGLNSSDFLPPPRPPTVSTRRRLLATSGSSGSSLQLLTCVPHFSSLHTRLLTPLLFGAMLRCHRMLAYFAAQLLSGSTRCHLPHCDHLLPHRYLVRLDQHLVAPFNRTLRSRIRNRTQERHGTFSRGLQSLRGRES